MTRSIDADKAMKYRQRAEHIRGIADGLLPAEESRERMLKVAEDYECLAAAIESMIGVLPSERKA